MKYLLTTTLLLITLAVNAQKEQKFHRITDTTDAYTISVPEGWRYLTKPERGSFEAWRPVSTDKPDIGMEVATLAILNFDHSLSELIRHEISYIKKDLKAEILDSATVNLNGRQAFVMFSRYVDAEDSSRWQSTIVLHQFKNQSFIFEGTAPDNAGSAYMFSIFKFMGISIVPTNP
ncbi:hypothetical protein MKQ68_06725 [Chitinophaga horti]|uniref:DUF1795 domain-containing protein n=1 Tax=Chitinophaga horti TaxID=2920382 RepID=A0ABY6J912_9BACT|nr:hypothetical protein [Chitinophaga horti]UYQ94784.1 hypothetical protein MKQ68_06725 [Chitinophaga horti]